MNKNDDENNESNENIELSMGELPPVSDGDGGKPRPEDSPGSSEEGSDSSKKKAGRSRKVSLKNLGEDAQIIPIAMG